MVTALSAALASRPADRLVATADAMLVVGGDRRRRGSQHWPIALCPCAVLGWGIRHARRRVHLERHNRSRSRREGGADALAADTGGAGECAASPGFSDTAGADRLGSIAAVQFIRGGNRYCFPDCHRSLSIYEADYLVAAGRARFGVFLGRADGVCGHARPN